MMTLITVHIPTEVKRAIDELVKAGVYKSKAEVVRRAIEELLKKHGIEPPQSPPSRPRMELQTKKAIRQLETLCRQEPWLCLSTALMKARGFSDHVVYKYIELTGAKYVYGLREDFYYVMARDIAAYVISNCGKSSYIHVKPRHIISAVGITATPPNIPAAVSYAMSLLSYIQRIRLKASVVYIYRCEDIQQHACDAGLSTVLYAYYAKRGDEQNAKLMYKHFEHCIK